MLILLLQGIARLLLVYCHHVGVLKCVAKCIFSAIKKIKPQIQGTDHKRLHWVCGIVLKLLIMKFSNNMTQHTILSSWQLFEN